MDLKPGLRLKSAVCDAEVMVVKAAGGGSISCGGAPMLAPGEAASAGASAAEDQLAGCQVGKRYVNDDQSVEVLCVKAGKGSLGLDGAPLVLKEAKKLPSSD
ncbi:MAG TPA: hypothetical protein VIS76_10620 [Pseudomonadales bacterium]